MQHKEIQINNQKIAYYESQGKGPAVVLIHGNSCSGLSFKRQLFDLLFAHHYGAESESLGTSCFSVLGNFFN